MLLGFGAILRTNPETGGGRGGGATSVSRIMRETWTLRSIFSTSGYMLHSGADLGGGGGHRRHVPPPLPFI